MSFWSRVVAGITAFREAYLRSDVERTYDSTDWSAYDARRFRYALAWAMYENDAYRAVNTWSSKMKADYGLYRYTRGIHNPSYRLGEFHAAHLLGGALDTAAGDGQATPSAIPILTGNERLRPAIAALWQASNWQIVKDIWTRRGAILGDIGLKVVDDVTRGKAYLCIVHPGSIREIDRDAWGHIKGYILEELRPDPRLTTAQVLSTRTIDDRLSRTVTYTEIAERGDDEDVVYTTLLNGAPYAWNGVAASWSEPYGFVPLVLTQHLNVGLEWGWSELHAGLAKFREVDDLASKLSDQIRKTVDSPWLFAGVQKPTTSPTTTGAAVTTTRPEPGREEVPILYATDPNARAQPLVAPLDIAGVSGRITAICAEIERDYPELQMDIWTASGDSSGRALRIARQRVTTKVQQRRASYDADLVRAQQMAVAIGGYRGYDGYAGFSLESYAAGDLDHQIGERPVFAVDPMDAIDEDTAFWAAAEAAGRAGYPLELYLADKGWSAEKIATMQQTAATRRATLREEQTGRVTPAMAMTQTSEDRALAVMRQAEEEANA